MNEQVAYFVELIRIYKDKVDDNTDNYFYSNQAKSEREKLLGLYLNNANTINHMLDGIDIDHLQVGGEDIQVVPVALSDDIKKAQYYLSIITDQFSKVDPEHDSNFMTQFEVDFRYFINKVLYNKHGESWCKNKSVLNRELYKKGVNNRKAHVSNEVSINFDKCIEILSGLTINDFEAILMNNFNLFHQYLGLSDHKSERQKLSQWFIAISRYRNPKMHTGDSADGVYELEGRAAIGRFLNAFNNI